MKTKTILLTAIALFLLIGAVGCKKESPSDADRIIGTWKCIGFGDTKTGEVRAIEPKDCEKCYILKFDKNKTLEGRALSNSISGTYNPATLQNKIEFIDVITTHLNEFFDGSRYIESIQRVTYYSFSSKGELLLYYNNREEWLIFKSIQL